MDRICMGIYWLGCAIVLLIFFTMNDFALFCDFLSLICTLLPACFSLFFLNHASGYSRASCFVKVGWISAALTTLYGVILALTHYPIDWDTFSGGISVALLPLFYALVIQLLTVPFLIRKPNDSERGI